jgi:hypothetical protein
MDRTGAAQGLTAAEFGAGQANFVAQVLQQRHVRVAVEAALNTIHDQRRHGVLIQSERFNLKDIFPFVLRARTVITVWLSTFDRIGEFHAHCLFCFQRNKISHQSFRLRGRPSWQSTFAPDARGGRWTLR